MAYKQNKITPFTQSTNRDYSTNPLTDEEAQSKHDQLKIDLEFAENKKDSTRLRKKFMDSAWVSTQVNTKNRIAKKKAEQKNH